MIAFVLKMCFALLLLGIYFIFRTNRNVSRVLINGSLALSIIIAITGIVQTSFIYVPADHFAVFTRTWPGKALPPGRKVAFAGEIGPQAAVRTSGAYFDLGLTLLNEVKYEPITMVPSGMCAVLFAKDGAMPKNGAAFAPIWDDAEYLRMINDAEYFLKSKEEGGGGGFRGPQATVLFPGPYTINPHLWEKVQFEPATVVEQGTVAAVKAYVAGDVNFGPFKRTRGDGKLQILTPEKLPTGAMNPSLVAVGEIGVWEEPLPNGIYYINPKAYIITRCPTIQFRLNYAGGYTKRVADLVPVDDSGKVDVTITTIEVPPVPDAADTAIPVKMEGFDAFIEERVLVQIPPMYAPFVVAGLGLNQDASAEVISKMVEDKVITPVLRSVTRNVTGGGQLTFTTKELQLKDGKPEILPNGELAMSSRTELRTPKVLDLIEQREVLEAAIEDKAREESRKEGIHITELRLAEAVIPAEISAARKREIAAAQHVKALLAEESAQAQRMKTENAKAQAEQQGKLVEAQIAKEAAQAKKEARVTEADGEKQYQLAIIEAQQKQKEILGPEMIVQLQMFDRGLKALTDLVQQNPTLLTEALRSANKFVPTIVVNGGSGGGGNTDNSAAALLFGSMLNPGAIKQFEELRSPPVKVGSPQE